jgi:uncharacterized protein YbjT (DUF2867 family)
VNTTPLRVALVGATGLVGRACLECLLARPDISRVVTVGRRSSGISSPKLDERLVTGMDTAQLASGEALDAGLCALGSTIAAAGSQAAFRDVDMNAVLAFARNARAGGSRRFVHVSSVGADPASSNFYLRAKGEVEEALRHLGFDSLDIIRPGLLLGDRVEARPIEALARRVAPFGSALAIGPLRKYRAIPSHVVARAMVAAALSASAGTRVHTHDGIHALARSLDPRS